MDTKGWLCIFISTFVKNLLYETEWPTFKSPFFSEWEKNKDLKKFFLESLFYQLKKEVFKETQLGISIVTLWSILTKGPILTLYLKCWFYIADIFNDTINNF